MEENLERISDIPVNGYVSGTIRSTIPVTSVCVCVYTGYFLRVFCHFLLKDTHVVSSRHGRHPSAMTKFLCLRSGPHILCERTDSLRCPTSKSYDPVPAFHGTLWNSIRKPLTEKLGFFQLSPIAVYVHRFDNGSASRIA